MILDAFFAVRNAILVRKWYITLCAAVMYQDLLRYCAQPPCCLGRNDALDVLYVRFSRFVHCLCVFAERWFQTCSAHNHVSCGLHFNETED